MSNEDGRYDLRHGKDYPAHRSNDSRVCPRCAARWAARGEELCLTCKNELDKLTGTEDN